MIRSRFCALAVLMSAILLGACAPTDKAADTTEPPPPPVNSAPTISGTPMTSVAAGTAYNFTPTAADVDAGTTLVFSITNKPGWASFSTSTGALTGTPTSANAGTTSGVAISVSDGDLSAQLPAFNLTVTTTAPTNHAPTISGTPATSVTVGNNYSFTPTAADVDAGTTLVFSITNKPAWATFSTSTGKLSGTPTNGNIGTTSGVRISVSDGSLSAQLPLFNLAVVAAPTSGSATLTWVAPTVNSDGTPLSDLAGYIIRYGTSSTSYSSNVRVADPSLQTYTVQNLASGTYFFAVAAFDTSDNTSTNSNQVTKTIP